MRIEVGWERQAGGGLTSEASHDCVYGNKGVTLWRLL